MIIEGGEERRGEGDLILGAPKEVVVTPPIPLSHRIGHFLALPSSPMPTLDNRMRGTGGRERLIRNQI